MKLRNEKNRVMGLVNKIKGNRKPISNRTSMEPLIALMIASRDSFRLANKNKIRNRNMLTTDHFCLSSAMFWLVLAYLLHTIGELCISPVALSYITKLAPVKYGSILMGVYFAMTGFGNKLAGLLGESASKFGEFTIFTGIAIFCISFGLIVMIFRKKLEVLTHGVEDREVDMTKVNKEGEGFELAD